MCYADGSYYEGEWVAGWREGAGVLLRNNGDIYEGEWRADQRHGRGRLTSRAGYLQQGWWRDNTARCSVCTKLPLGEAGHP